MKVENEGTVSVLRPECDHLDASNRDDFRTDLEACSSQAAKIVLDLSPVRFVDSSGLGVIMGILKHLRASGGDMVAFGINKPVMVLFDLVRLDRVLSVYPSRAEAVASFTVEDK